MLISPKRDKISKFQVHIWNQANFTSDVVLYFIKKIEKLQIIDLDDSAWHEGSDRGAMSPF